MKTQIIESLKRLNIEKYLITQVQSESLECFYIKKKLDLKRITDTTDISVTVYHTFEKDGQRMLGSSEVQLYQGMEEEELDAALQKAYQAAALVCNPYYELVQGKKEAFVPSNSSLAGHSMEENMKRITEALFAADRQEKVFINSAELFVKRWRRYISSSEGVDTGYALDEISGEYVIQCVEPQDVETYHSFSYRDDGAEALQRDVEEALLMTQARAQAHQAPKAGEYDIILSGESMRTLLGYYLDRSGTLMVYRKYSGYEVGAQVQGKEPGGDALTVELKAREPYSREGIPMKNRILMENGVLKLLHGGSRYAYYLGMEPTGEYSCIHVPTGSTPLQELKTGSYLHIVKFSDFQMDSYSGYFSGEIRLAYLCDGEKTIPVTGGSINGSILKVQDHMRFSKERYANGYYEGPLAVRIEGVSVAGADE